MKIKELREKSEAELNKLLKENRNKLRELNFAVSQNQLKNVRDVRKTKTLIAQILTIMKEKKK